MTRAQVVDDVADVAHRARHASVDLLLGVVVTGAGSAEVARDAVLRGVAEPEVVAADRQHDHLDVEVLDHLDELIALRVRVLEGRPAGRLAQDVDGLRARAREVDRGGAQPRRRDRLGHVGPVAAVDVAAAEVDLRQVGHAVGERPVRSGAVAAGRRAVALPAAGLARDVAVAQRDDRPLRGLRPGVGGGRGSEEAAQHHGGHRRASHRDPSHRVAGQPTDRPSRPVPVQRTTSTRRSRVTRSPSRITTRSV